MIFSLQNSQSLAFYYKQESFFLPHLSVISMDSWISMLFSSLEFITVLNYFVVLIVPDLASRNPSKLAPVFLLLFFFLVAFPYFQV